MMHGNSTISYPAGVVVTTGISCVMSIFGSVVIFWTYRALCEIRNFVRKLVLCLTVADVISAIGYLIAVVRNAVQINEHGDSVLCKVQSSITTFSSIASFLLTITIAVHIFCAVVFRVQTKSTSKWLLTYNIICWAIPSVVVLAALSEDILGRSATSDTGPWCWIDTSVDNLVWWMIFGGKGWEIACYLVTTTLYVLLILHVYLRRRYHAFNSLHVSLRIEDRNFLYVWLVLYCIRIWGTIRFFLIISNVESAGTIIDDVMIYLQAFGDPSQAFFNFLLFCVFDKTVRQKLISVVNCKQPVEAVPLIQERN